MDPNETLRRARQAAANGDLDEATEAYSDLDAWIVKGGYLPDAWMVARR